MKKHLQFFSLIIAFFAIFQTQTVKADNYAATLPGNTSTTANTSSFIRIDGARVKSKITALPFTVEMSFKPSAFNAYGGLWSDRSSGTATTLQYNNTTNSIRFDYAGVSSVLMPASAVTVLNAWNHVAVVVTSTSVKLVLNGVTYQRTGMTNTVVPFSGKSFIGQDSASTATLNRTVTGQFDEIRFWSTARTDAELNANKFKPLTGGEAGLVAYYNFDSQNVNDGTANAINAISPATPLVFKNLTTDTSMFSSADVTGINFSQGVLGADFTAGTTTYTAYVPPTSTNTVDVSGVPAAYLPPVVQTVDLTQASPTAAIAVTSMDGTVNKTYNVNIVKTDLSTYWSGSSIAVTGNSRSYPNLWGWKCSNTDNCWSMANSSGTAIRYNDVLTSANTWWATTPSTPWGGRLLYLRWDGTGSTTVNSVFSYPVSLVAGKSYTFKYKYSWANNATQPTFTLGVATDPEAFSVIATDTAMASIKKQYLKSKSLTFTALTSGTNFITFKSSTASLCAVADLSLVEDNTTENITSSVNSLSFDKSNLTKTFVVGAANLTGSDITLIPPAGITLSKTTVTIAEALSGTTITATYDNATAIFNGIISITNGTVTKKISVSGSNDGSCFTQFYPTLTNLISDPYFNSLSTYAGWGTKSISSDPAKVFCGTNCGMLGNGTARNIGSIDFNLTGKMLANTTYKVHAMVLTVGTGLSMEIGIGGCGVNGITSDFNTLITTNDVWAPVELTFTTGTLGATQGIYFNNANSATALTGYIDNYELYAVPAIYAPTTVSFTGTGSQTMLVRGVSFTDNITITAPSGYTVSPSTFAPSATGTTVTVTFNSATTTSGNLTLTNAAGTVTQTVAVTGTMPPTMVASPVSLILDDLKTTDSFVVNGENLLSDITITAPEGITVNPATIPAGSASGVTVNVMYDATTSNVSGNITLTSGTTSANVAVKATKNSDCFTPLYPALTNLITDPYFNSLSTYSGWGTKSISSDPAKVYCGINCGMLGNGTVRDIGSIDFNLTGKMLDNTTYKVHAMVLTVGTGLSMEIGIGGCGVNGSTTDFNTLITTNDVWAPVDLTFTTGTLGTTQGIYFNNSNSATALTGYIDNYELYAVPAIYAPTTVSFTGTGSQTMVVRGVSFNDNITITAPIGYTVSPSTFAPSETGTTVTVTFNSATTTNGNLTLTNAAGTVTQTVAVTGTVTPTIVASPVSLILDDLKTTDSFVVNGGNLLSDITITAPEGIIVNPSTIPAGSASEVTVNVMYDATTSNVSGNITLTSETTTANVAVTASKNSDCFTPLYPSLTNLIPNPYMNDISAFGGWGHKSVVFGESYCGAACVKFDAMTNTNPDGSALDVPIVDWVPNSTYRLHAWVKSVDGTFAFLAKGTNPDVTISVSQTTDQWVLIDQTFTTGATTTAGFFTFNNVDGASTGKVAYIDNYELYNISSTITKTDDPANNQNQKVYLRDNKIVADFNLAEASNVEFAVYNVQGMLLSKEKASFQAGVNQKLLNANLTSGVYLVKLSGKGMAFTTRVIK